QSGWKEERRPERAARKRACRRASGISNRGPKHRCPTNARPKDRRWGRLETAVHTERAQKPWRTPSAQRLGRERWPPPFEEESLSAPHEGASGQIGKRVRCEHHQTDDEGHINDQGQV